MVMVEVGLELALLRPGWYLMDGWVHHPEIRPPWVCIILEGGATMPESTVSTCRVWKSPRNVTGYCAKQSLAHRRRNGHTLNFSST